MPSNRKDGIAFLVNQLGVGGAERVFVNDANTFVRNDHQVIFFMLYGDEGAQRLAVELDPRIRQVLVRAKGPFDLRAMRTIVNSMQQTNAKILLSTLNDANLMARWCKLIAPGTFRLYIREANDPAKKPRWQRLCSIFFDSVATRVIAVTEQVRRGLLHDAPWRSRRIVVLHNAVEIPLVIPSHEHEGPVRVLTVGSLTEQKDHAAFISALAHLKESGVRFEAKIVGGGPLESAVKKQAHDAGLSELEFTGKLSHTEAMREYEWADIFVLSSLWEGCPNVVLEAMAHALPVVSTKVGGVPELVNDSCALLVPPENRERLARALKELSESAARRRTFGAAAHERAKQEFSSEVRYSRLEKILSLA